MRLLACVVCLLTFCIPCLADEVPDTLSKPVALEASGIPVSEILVRLHEQTGVNIVSALPTANATVAVSGVPLGQALDALSTSAGLQWCLEGSTVILKSAMPPRLPDPPAKLELVPDLDYQIIEFLYSLNETQLAQMKEGEYVPYGALQPEQQKIIQTIFTTSGLIASRGEHEAHATFPPLESMRFQFAVDVCGFFMRPSFPHTFRFDTPKEWSMSCRNDSAVAEKPVRRARRQPHGLPLSGTVDLAASDSTVGDILGKLRTDKLAALYCDRRWRDIPVAAMGAIPLSELTKALEATTGLVWRKVGDLYFLALDEIGYATQEWAILNEFEQQRGEARNWLSTLKDWLAEPGNSPFRIRADEVWQDVFKNPRVHHGGHWRVLVSALTPEQMGWLTEHLAGTPATTGAKDESVIIQIEGLTMLVEADGDVYTRMARLSPWTFPTNVQTIPDLDRAEHLPADRPEIAKSAPRQRILGAFIREDLRFDYSAFINAARKAGINSLFVGAFATGHSAYPSSVVAQKREYVGTDPLARIVEAASAAGITVYPFLSINPWRDKSVAIPRILEEHPEMHELNVAGQTCGQYLRETLGPALKRQPPTGVWQRWSALMKNVCATRASTMYISPSSQIAQKVLCDIASETLQRYNVGGICLADLYDLEVRASPFPFLRVPFRYAVDARTRMIRKHGLDPVDVPLRSSYGARSRIHGEQPGKERLRRKQESRQLQRIFNTFRRDEWTNFVATLAAAVKSADPNKLVFVNPTYGEFDVLTWAKCTPVDAILHQWGFPDDHRVWGRITDLRKRLEKKAAVIPAFRVSETRQNLASAMWKRAVESDVPCAVVTGTAEELVKFFDRVSVGK